jgi:hypothetical protein
MDFFTFLQSQKVSSTNLKQQRREIWTSIPGVVSDTGVYPTRPYGAGLSLCVTLARTPAPPNSGMVHADVEVAIGNGTV